MFLFIIIIIVVKIKGDKFVFQYYYSNLIFYLQKTFTKHRNFILYPRFGHLAFVCDRDVLSGFTRRLNFFLFNFLIKTKQFFLILGTILIGSGTKNPKIILDQNEFTINTKQGARTRWRCTQYFKSKCRASLVTYGRIVKVSHFHNHPPTNPSEQNLLPQIVTIVRNRRIIVKSKLPLVNLLQ